VRLHCQRRRLIIAYLPAIFIRDIALTFVFLSVVTALARLGQSRRLFFESAREQRDELLSEVELAAEVQENLLLLNHPPAGLPYDIAATMTPAKGVGGDYYDFVEMGDGQLGVVIADVAGKGLSAALLMPAAAITLQGLAESTHDPSKVLKELNQILYENTGRANYATVFHESLNIESGHLLYASSGQLPGLVVQVNGHHEWLTEGGTPIGLPPGAEYQTGETELNSGDVLVLYTDGIAEVENDSQAPFGEDRLLDVVTANRSSFAATIEAAIRRAVDEYSNGDGGFDDATLIVVKAPSG
jgi:sigma-B regulation protein RsbU (phosphoserine phosphatase)